MLARGFRWSPSDVLALDARELRWWLERLAETTRRD